MITGNYIIGLKIPLKTGVTVSDTGNLAKFSGLMESGNFEENH